MARASLVHRVEILEDKMEALGDLPRRVSAVEENLAGLRTEMRQGFARVDARFERIDGRLDGMDSRFAQVDGELATLRKEMHEGNEETRRQMRVLHEDVIARLALIQEHSTGTTSSRDFKRRRPKR